MREGFISNSKKIERKILYIMYNSLLQMTYIRSYSTYNRYSACPEGYNTVLYNINSLNSQNETMNIDVVGCLLNPNYENRTAETLTAVILGTISASILILSIAARIRTGVWWCDVCCYNRCSDRTYNAFCCWSNLRHVFGIPREQGIPAEQRTPLVKPKPLTPFDILGSRHAEYIRGELTEELKAAMKGLNATQRNVLVQYAKSHNRQNIVDYLTANETITVSV